MTLREYLATLQNKTVAVIGIGVSNTPLVELLCRSGISVIACDRQERAKLVEKAEKLEALGAKLLLGTEYPNEIPGDVIFRTPGMRPDAPELQAARERGSVITSEMQVFFEVSPCPILAVTGSDGKTTTTSIIAEMLRTAGKTVHLGGNIGHPLLAEADAMQPDDIAVVELSSFQLFDMTKSPKIAVITNLAPNHLDVHHGMEEYVAAKKNIFLHQGESDLLVLNADNAVTAALAPEARGRVRTFARVGGRQNGAFVRDGSIVLSTEGKERTILHTDEIRIPGAHNVENYLAAITALDGIVPDAVMAQVARDFSGVEHRIEWLRTLHGVRWYNDSIASSPSRTIAGLRTFTDPIILIAGGRDKHVPFTPLVPEIIRRVKLLILCGESANAIAAALETCPDYHGAPEIVYAASLRECVKIANERAVSGDVVTLSPACAAFDQFKNFMERGDTFRAYVAELPE